MATPCSRTSWSERRHDDSLRPDPVDLRSDTVTQPTPAMREAMIARAAGRRRVRRPTRASMRCRRRSPACWVSRRRCSCRPARRATSARSCRIASAATSTSSASMAHCYRWEGGGAAVLGSVQPQPLDHAAGRHAAAARTSKPRSSPTTRTSRARGCWRWRTRSAASCCRSPMSRQATHWRTRRGWRAISTARGFSTPRSRRPRGAGGSGRARSRSAPHRAAASTASRCASARGWARRSARRCADRASSSRARTACARWPAAACARRACWRPPRRMRSTHHVDRLADDHALAQRLAAGPGRHRRACRSRRRRPTCVFVDLVGDARARSADCWPI